MKKMGSQKISSLESRQATGSSNSDMSERGSYLDRLENEDLCQLKRLLGAYIATEVLNNVERVFIVSGTTPRFVAEEIIQRHANISVFTNSVPTLKMAMDIAHEDKLAKGVTVRAIGGQVDLETGIIANTKLSKVKNCTLIYSPHGLTEEGIVGYRDTEYLKAVIARCCDVIMPMTLNKLGKNAEHTVKHFGQIALDCKKSRRQYRIVLPPMNSSDALSVKPLLAKYELAGVKITNVPSSYKRSESRKSNS